MLNAKHNLNTPGELEVSCLTPGKAETILKQRSQTAAHNGTIVRNIIARSLSLDGVRNLKISLSNPYHSSLT
jgi:hypothetical protein